MLDIFTDGSRVTQFLELRKIHRFYFTKYKVPRSDTPEIRPPAPGDFQVIFWLTTDTALQVQFPNA